jgi:hypothetical protein
MKVEQQYENRSNKKYQRRMNNKMYEGRLNNTTVDNECTTIEKQVKLEMKLSFLRKNL